jgi:hypothetical protein
MAVSSVGLRLKCDCSGKAQKQLYSKLQTRFLVREDAFIAKRRNCQTKEEVLQSRSTSETLRMLEEACAKAAMKTLQVYECKSKSLAETKIPP